MGERRGASAAIVALLIVALAACTPEAAPAPPPSPSVVSSEDAAFAAAEATYRAYVDAVNARRADPDSPLDPESLLTAAALIDHQKTEELLESRGLTIDGPSVVRSASHVKHSGQVRLIVCLDATRTSVLDASGRDVTPKLRAEVVAIDVRFASRDGSMLIAGATTADAEC